MAATASWRSGTPSGVSARIPAAERRPNAAERCLHLCTSKSDGGIEQSAVRLCAELMRQHVTAACACLPHGPAWQMCEAANVPTLPLAPRNSGDAAAVFALVSHLTRFQADILHVHSRRDYLPALFAVLMARARLKRPIALILHAHMVRDLGQPARLSARVLGGGADALICVSHAVKCQVTQSGGFDGAKAHVLHNGVNVNAFAAAGTARANVWRESVRRELNIHSGALVLTMVGRLDAKGQAALLDVLPCLATRFGDVQAVFVGEDGKPGERARLTQKAHALGVAGRVSFTGPRPDVPRLFAAADVCVHLPTDEAFGLAIAEGMAAGVPVVATNAGGCPEVVRHGVTGLLVPPHDPAALCAALERLLCGESGKRLREQMGAAGRTRAEHLFSLSVQTARVRDLYAALRANAARA